jgi:D-xylose 1-dehydrogenase (NADP+, D-xylono-1,5-lactone-forming)
MAKQFQWGLLSTAKINGAILSAMPNSAHGEMLAVGSRDLAKAQAYAAEHHLARAYGSYEELLADPDVNIVYIGLPNGLHAEWTIKALQAGKHVLCEKPFALTLADVDAMHAAAQAAQRVVAEAFMYRHHPMVIRAKELMDSGVIGTPRFLRSSFSFYLDRAYNVRWDPAIGGGAMWDLGGYPVSLARYFFGVPERVEGWQVLGPSGVDETVAASLYFPAQRVAQIDVSFRMPFRCLAEIVGESGSLVLSHPFHSDNPEATLMLRQGDERESVPTPQAERYLLEIEDLHDAILTGRSPLVTAAETRGHIETILDIYQSAQAK